MADVFVSYVSEDRDAAQKISQGLEGAGLSVWWDRHIRGGADFTTEIDQQLAAAKVVLVLWSNASINSTWVRDEAQQARDDNKLIPLRLDNVQPPLGFRQTQSLDFTNWNGEPAAQAFTKLVESTRHYVGNTTALAPATARATTPRRSGSRRAQRSVQIAAIAVVLIGAGAGAWWFQHSRPSVALPDRSIAVLPFTPMSEDPDVRHLADGFVEELLNDLARQQKLKVASRTESAAKASDQSVAAVADALSVSYVLEGSVRAFGEGNRVTAQLIRGRNRAHVWSQTFDVDRSPADMEDTARVIALYSFRYIDIDVTLAEDRAETNNAAAFTYYEKAVRDLWALQISGTDLAVPGGPIIANLNKAIELDPSFPQPYLQLAHAIAWGQKDIDFEQRKLEARRAIDRYLELRPNSAEGYVWRGFIQMDYELDLAAAERSLRRAQELEPNLPWTYGALAQLAMRRGDSGAAVFYWKQELELDASVWNAHTFYAQALINEGDFTSADRELEIAIHLRPQGGPLIYNTVVRIIVASLMGHTEEARKRFDAAWAKLGQTAPDAFVPVLSQMGHAQELRELMKQWDAGTRFATAADRFQAHYQLGEYDEAIKWLEPALDERDPFFLKVIRLEKVWPELRTRADFTEALAHLDSLEVSH